MLHRTNLVFLVFLYTFVIGIMISIRVQDRIIYTLDFRVMYVYV